MLNVLSFDVANKSLAVALIRFDTKKYERIEHALGEFRAIKTSGVTGAVLLRAFVDMLDRILHIYDNAIDIKYVAVKDLIPGKKLSDTDILARTAALNEYLIQLDTAVAPFVDPAEELKVLIEYQMGPNEKSRAVSSQLLYHYTNVLFVAGRPVDGNIILVGPSLKNTIYIGADDASYVNFLNNRRTNYAANKAHSRFNLVRLFGIVGKSDMLRDIAKKNYDDLGDAVMMAVAWVVKWQGL